MAGINIMIDQARKEIEAIIEGVERSAGDEKTRIQLEKVEQDWWTYPTDIRAKFPDYIREWFETRRRQQDHPSD